MPRSSVFLLVIAVLVITLSACAGEMANESPVAPDEGEHESEAACSARVRAVPPPRTPSGEEIPYDKANRPRLISGSEHPDYPDTRLLIRHNVHLAARCVLRTDGALSNCTMICSEPLLDEALLQNLATRRYTPFMFRGHPIEAPYTFSIRIPALPL